MRPFDVVATECCASCGAWVVELVDDQDRCWSCAGLEWRLWRSVQDAKKRSEK